MSPSKKFSLSSHHHTPSRTPSDESSTSGYLSVPKQRLRGSSLSGDSELSLRYSYIENASFLVYTLHSIPSLSYIMIFQCFGKMTIKSLAEALIFFLKSLKEFDYIKSSGSRKFNYHSIINIDNNICSLNNVYLLRQFSIAGRKVIHVGDSLHQRTFSSSSINSNRSRWLQ